MSETLPVIETVPDVDRLLLAEARSTLGAPSDTETVNQALAALIREHRRRAAVEHEIQRLESGAYAAVSTTGTGPTGGAR